MTDLEGNSRMKKPKNRMRKYDLLHCPNCGKYLPRMLTGCSDCPSWRVFGYGWIYRDKVIKSNNDNLKSTDRGNIFL